MHIFRLEQETGVLGGNPQSTGRTYNLIGCAQRMAGINPLKPEVEGRHTSLFMLNNSVFHVYNTQEPIKECKETTKEQTAIVYKYA